MEYTEYNYIINLSNVPNFKEILLNVNVPNFIKSDEYKIKEEKFNIIRYDKKYLSNFNTKTYGLLRSIVSSHTDVLCFSPPKSVSTEYFIENYNLKHDNIIVEEFIEGTMINVFYIDTLDMWMVSTKNTIGADTYYNQNNKNYTFKEMFFDACKKCNFDIKDLDKDFCYSFVLQHPKNRIISPITEQQIYIIEIYKIIKNHDGNIDIYNIPLSHFSRLIKHNLHTIKFPNTYQFTDYSSVIDTFASTNTPYHIMGIIIKNYNNGERCKIRNPNYEEVKNLKGNHTKNQYLYLVLRNTGKLKDYFKFFPECKNEFSVYRDKVHIFTYSLYENYIMCYVYKKKPLRDFPKQFSHHMYKLHGLYIDELKPNNEHVNIKVVQDYVNKLEPRFLMYSINYNLRQKKCMDKLIDLYHPQLKE